MAFLISRRSFPPVGKLRATLALLAAVAWLAVAGSRASAAVPPAPAPPSNEYQVKAVFLFNFAQFAEWPASAFRMPSSPLVIGVLGEDPFGAYLDELVKGEKIGAHPLQVQRFASVKDLPPCHILFISRSETERLDQIMPLLKDRSILTVSDVDTFTRHGGLVRFVTVDGKIRLRIYLDGAKAAGLTISSKIVRPATIVTPEKD